MKKTLTLLLFTVFVFCVSVFSFAGNRSGNKLVFGPLISGIEETGIVTREKAASGNHEEIPFSIDVSNISLRKMGNYDYIAIKGLKGLKTSTGEPNVPVKIFKLTFSRDTEIKGVEVTDIQYRPFFTPLLIAPTPKPIKMSKIKKMGVSPMKPDKEIYSSSKFFPEKIVTYYTGCDRKYRYVYVRFYPLQCIPRSKYSQIIISAVIKIYYEGEIVKENR